MPWKKKSKELQKLDLVRAMVAANGSVTELAQRFGVSRQTAYKWCARFRAGRLRGLRERSRRPLFFAAQTDDLWLRRVRRLRGRHPTWGARKLRHVLARRFGDERSPSVAAIGRWLKRWGLTRGRRRRLRGPQIARRAVLQSQRCHEVKGNGEIAWRGKRRYVGEAFVRDYVGLKPVGFGVWRVYFGPMLVGELREKEVGAIRMARYARAG